MRVKLRRGSSGDLPPAQALELTFQHQVWNFTPDQEILVLESISQILSSMTTFTKIQDSEIPTISINPDHVIAPIDDNVYGGFTEFVPLCLKK